MSNSIVLDLDVGSQPGLQDKNKRAKGTTGLRKGSG